MSKFDKRKILLIDLIIWSLLALLLIIRPILYGDWLILENFVGFLLAIVTVILIQHLYGKADLKIALPVGYSLLVLVITILEVMNPQEQGWSWFVVIALGMPLGLFTYLIYGAVTYVFGDQIIARTISYGMGFAILGSIQYFLIGKFLQKVYEAIIEKFRNRR